MGADQRHCLLTLVERVTGFVVIRKLSARTKEQATAALQRALLELDGAVASITLDNGTEFHDYRLVEQRSGVTIYFAFLVYSQALIQFDVGNASAGGLVAVVIANIVAFFLVRIVGRNLEA